MRLWDFESLKYLKTSPVCFDGQENLKVGISGKASPFWAFHRSFVPFGARSSFLGRQGKM